MESPQYWPLNEKGIQERHHPVIHITADMGPVGNTAMNYFIHGPIRCRGTKNPDWAHRLTNDFKSALTAAGLNILRVEYKGLLKVREGPFSPGGGNHGLMKGAAKWMFETSNWNSNFFFDLLFTDLATAVKIKHQRHECDAHKRLVWDALKKMLLSNAKGNNTKAYHKSVTA